MQIPYKVFLIEKKHRFFRLLVSVVLLCSINSCSSSSGIDDYFTFNLQKTFSSSLDSGKAGVLTSPQIIAIDSADLAANRTTLALIKSIKLTRFALTSNIPAVSISSVIDSMHVDAADSSENVQPLVVYIGANDSTYLSNADYATDLHGLYKFKTYFHNPPQGFIYTAHYTVAITARPK